MTKIAEIRPKFVRNLLVIVKKNKSKSKRGEFMISSQSTKFFFCRRVIFFMGRQNMFVCYELVFTLDLLRPLPRPRRPLTSWLDNISMIIIITRRLNRNFAIAIQSVESYFH